MYSHLVNNPLTRSFLTYPYVWWDNSFTQKELKSMNTFFASNGVEDATLFKRNAASDAKNEKIQEPIENYRKSKIKFYNRDDETNWIFKRLNMVFEEINDAYYNFDLNGYDHFQYTEYESNYSGHYDYHSDIIYGEYSPNKIIETRKLSFIMALNTPGVDYEGGNLEINTASESNAISVEMKLGRIIAFPSWMLHRITPITKGKRKSLVTWVTGPKFK